MEPITIHYGAGVKTVTYQGQTLSLLNLDRHTKRAVKQAIKDEWEKKGKEPKDAR